MLRVGITRDLSQLVDLKSQAVQRDVEIVPIPLQTIRPIAFEWPPALNGLAPDWAVFTSAHGVESFFRRLSDLGRPLSFSSKIAAVGTKTAMALAQFGRFATLVPDEAYGEQLFTLLVAEHVSAGNRVLYARGAEINFDPAPMLAAKQVEYYPLICYRTEPSPVSKRAVGSFGPTDYILFTAPSTVRAWHEQFGEPRCRAIAIGRTTEREMTLLGWPRISTMPVPDVNTILEYITWNS
ncbi:MAG: uroporphyrinogen-III synthase [Candidatus Zixiibacteriota bacterium]